MKKVTYKPDHVFIGSMKQNGHRNYIYITLLTLLVLTLPSCMREENVIHSSGKADGSERKVILRMSVPYTASGLQARSINASAENTINTVDVLVFRIDETGEYYDYSAIGYKTPGNTEGSSTQSFTVAVRAHTYQQRFVTITNARTEVQQLIGSSDWDGMEKEMMLARLEISIEGNDNKWNANSTSDYATLPMWGESAAENITNATTELSGPILLLRMLAKINVQLDKSADGLTDMFKLKSVRLYNTNTKGRIVPEAGTLVQEIRFNNPYLMVNSPSIPASVEDYSARHLGPVLYEDFSAPGETDVAIRGAIYMFETRSVDKEHRLEATCLVVGGLYGDDIAESYYRIDFLESDTTTFRHILRNNQYIINIVRVKDRGHPTPEDAFESTPGEIIVDISLDVFDAITGEILTELIFSSEVGITPDARYMDITWTPITTNLSIVNTPVSPIAFPSESGAPASGTVEGGSGTVSYVIQPPALTPAETTPPGGDPFLEKVSRLDFTISDEGSTVSRSVFLRQIYYNLLTDQADYYSLDGSTYTFHVRCNAAWRIKSVVESTPMLAPKAGDNLSVGTTGGNNTSVGDVITFTVVNNPRLWGTIEVTFESEDTPGKFSDKTITLLFAARRIKLLGMAYTNVYGYNPAVSSTSNYGIDANTMLSAAANFGTLPTSKVITEGFTFIGGNLTGTITDAVLKSYLDQEPDIVVLGFDLYITATQAQMYLDYLRNGGVLIAYCEGNGNGAQTLMRAMFNDATIVQDRVNDAGAVYGIPNIEDDRILTGPFGDLRNKQWGDDASQTCGVRNLPSSEIEIYSTAEDISGIPSSINPGTTPADWVTAFRHKTLKFVWFGDGGFLSTYPIGSNIAYPCKIDATSKAPIPYTGTGNGYGRGTAKYNVYNSQLFANMVAWGISEE